MHRPSRDNGIRESSLETALAERPETYGRLDVLRSDFLVQIYQMPTRQARASRVKEAVSSMSVCGLLDYCVPNGSLSRTSRASKRSTTDGISVKSCRKFPKAGMGINGMFLIAKTSECRNNAKDCSLLDILEDHVHPRYYFSLKGITGMIRRTMKHHPLATVLMLDRAKDRTRRLKPLSLKTVTRCTGINNARNDNIVGKTLKTGGWGNSFAWRENYIAETVPDRIGEIAGIPRGLDTARRCVVGNAVSVPVAEYIGLRIARYEGESKA